MVTRQDRGTLLVLLAAVGFGLNPLLAKWAFADGLTAETSLIYRIGIPALCLLPFLRGGFNAPRAALFTVLMGGIMAIGTLSYFKALEVLPVSTAAVVYYSYPLLTVVIGFLLFGERASANSLIGGVLVLVGSGLILGPADFNEDQLRAAVVCLLAPICFAVLIHGLSKVANELTAATQIALSQWGHMVVILPVALLAEEPLTPASSAGWTAIACLVTVGALLPQILFVNGLRLVGPSRSAVAGCSELLTSVGVACLILSERLSSQAMIGLMVLVVAILASQWRGRESIRPALAPPTAQPLSRVSPTGSFIAVAPKA